MDKRTLIAFGLMFLVLFGWSALFGPEPPETPPEDAPDEARPVVETSAPAPSRPDPIPAAAVGDSVEPSSWTLAPEEVGELIRVETDLFLADFDRVGGDLVAWRLKDFDRVEGGAVDLISPHGLQGTTQRAHALRLFFENAEFDLARVAFDASSSRLSALDPGDVATLTLRAPTPDGGTLEIIYGFSAGQYGFDVDLVYRDEDRLQRPTHLKVDWPGGIAGSEPDSVQDYNEFKAVARVGDDVHRKSFKDLSKDGGAKGRATYDGTVSWAGTISRYFATLLVAPDVPAGRVKFDGDHARHLQTFSARLPMTGDSEARASYSVYLGPLDSEAMAVYAGEHNDANIAQLVDMGPGPLRWLSEWTLEALKLLYKVIPNYGWVIIIFSAFTKLLFYPLTKSSTMSMRRMSEIQPELTKMREKYKDDPQKQSQAMMEMYKKHKINPLGGCLPLLIQMPVFFALFTILRKTIELRQADFALWINDLSRPDVLFELPFTLPMFGNNFSVLPFLMAVGMWAQTKLSQTPNAAQSGAMAQQMKMMGTLMPIFMFVMFYNSPSGLVLYWFVNTILTALQTWRIHQKMSPLAPEPEAEPA